jgi:MULE transposase domain
VYIGSEVTHLFFAHPKSVELFQQYLEVILMDCTYKTNWFRMPLLNIVGSTGLGTNFYIGFAFFLAEGEGDYMWVLKELKTLMCGKDIPDPMVVVTDRELVLINAVSAVFPIALGLLCEWHVSNAILVNVKKQKTFVKSSGERDVDKEKRFMTQFAEVTSSPSATIYQQRLTALKESFQQHQKLLRYVETVWLGP